MNLKVHMETALSVGDGKESATHQNLPWFILNKWFLMISTCKLSKYILHLQEHIWLTNHCGTYVAYTFNTVSTDTAS